MIKALWIDTVLPEQFVLTQGKYLQTSTHVEKVLWSTLIYAEDSDFGTLEDVSKAFTQR